MTRKESGARVIKRHSTGAVVVDLRFAISEMGERALITGCDQVNRNRPIRATGDPITRELRWELLRHGCHPSAGQGRTHRMTTQRAPAPRWRRPRLAPDHFCNTLMVAGAGASWSAFEQRVANLYRDAGADAHIDYPLSGSQIDVFVIERTSAGTAVRLAVECKSGAQITGVKDVERFETRVDGFRRHNEADIGVIVAEHGFSRPAREKAAVSGIHLVTMEELERRALGDTSLPSTTRLAILTARQLRHQFLPMVRSAEPLTTFELDDLLLQVIKALEQLQEAIDTTRQLPTPATGVRRAVGALLRVEDEAERCFDAARHLRTVAERFNEAEHSSAPVISELDHTTATSFRIRELEQARGHLAYRLRRLEEASYRALETG